MHDILNSLIPNIMDKVPEFWDSVAQTFIMIGVVGVISFIFGVILGVILICTREGDILENKVVYFILGKLIDLFRAIPFIILLTLLMPVTRALMGTAIQTKGSIFPLVIGTIPFFARQIESALAQVDRGLIEASQAMGESPIQIIWRVYLKESIPGLIRAASITLISLIGLIAMVGAIGGGGLGDFCIRYGYNSRQEDVTYVCVFVLLIITTLIQGFSNIAIKKTTH